MTDMDKVTQIRRGKNRDMSRIIEKMAHSQRSGTVRKQPIPAEIRERVHRQPPDVDYEGIAIRGMLRRVGDIQESRR